MRVQFNSINGEKIAITHVEEIRQGINRINFKSLGYISMELYIDDVLFMEAGELYEATSNIDSQIVLSADKE